MPANYFDETTHEARMFTDSLNIARRLLRKTVRQSCAERRGEEVQTALRMGHSPMCWILANGKTLPVFPISEGLFWVEPPSAARTMLADLIDSLPERRA